MPKMNKLNERKYDSEYITWKTANEDISKQRKKGYKGKRFLRMLIIFYLINIALYASSQNYKLQEESLHGQI